MEDDFLGINQLDTGVGSAGVGFVVVPVEKDREQYINDCYRTSTLSISGGMGYGFFNGVYCPTNVLENIQFPVDDSRGTPVVWVRDAMSGLPVIVASLRKQGDYYGLGEHKWRISRGMEQRNVEICVDGENSEIDINIIGDESQPANLNIKVNSKNRDSVINLSCDNVIKLESENEIILESNKKTTLLVKEEGKEKCSLTYEIGVGLKYIDEFENEIISNENNLKLVSKTINHNEGSEPMVLGDTLESLLKDLINAITKITVPTPTGISGTPINSAVFKTISSKLNTFLSKISNLD